MGEGQYSHVFNEHALYVQVKLFFAKCDCANFTLLLDLTTIFWVSVVLLHTDIVFKAICDHEIENIKP